MLVKENGNSLISINNLHEISDWGIYNQLYKLKNNVSKMFSPSKVFGFDTDPQVIQKTILPIPPKTIPSSFFQVTFW